jgi:hypothetical protein
MKIKGPVNEGGYNKLFKACYDYIDFIQNPRYDLLWRNKQGDPVYSDKYSDLLVSIAEAGLDYVYGEGWRKVTE